MSDQYYRFFPGDYLRDTQGLTLTENGAYRALLDSYYSNETLIDDIDELCIICRAYQDFERKAVEKVMTKYFSKNGNGRLVNKRADREIASRREYIAEQTRKSKLGVEARKSTRELTQHPPKGQPGINSTSNPKTSSSQFNQNNINTINNTQPTGKPTGSPTGQPGVNPLSPSPSLKKEYKKKPATAPEQLTKEDLTESSVTKIKQELAKLTETLYRENIFPDAPKFKNQMLKQGKNPRSILHTFIRCQIRKPEDAWGYCMKIMQVEDGNYNERDATKAY